MASIQEIKRRIKAVSNTGQITKAMEMVSANKMRRSQEVALLSRPYALYVLRLLSELRTRAPEYLPEIMRDREVKKTVVVLAPADRGLAGSFNANILRSFEQTMNQESARDNLVYVGVGKKAEEFFARKGIKPVQTFKNFGDYASPEETKPLSELLIKGFLSREWDRVIVVSTHFRTTLRQEVMIREVLPIDALKLIRSVNELVPEYGRYAGQTLNVIESLSVKEKRDFEYLIEPDPKAVLHDLAPRLVHTILYQLVLEANASEHSARMVGLENPFPKPTQLKN